MSTYLGISLELLGEILMDIEPVDFSAAYYNEQELQEQKDLLASKKKEDKLVKKKKELPDVLSYEYYEKEQDLIRALKSDREESINEYRENIRAEDDRQRFSSRSRSTYSTFDNNRIVNNWCGHTSPDRFWFDRTRYEVDKTVTTPFYVPEPDSTYDFDSDWYKEETKLSDYKAIVIQLSRHTTEREYGRVFFSTATRYVSIDQEDICPRKIAQPIRGYIIKAGHKIYCDSYRKPLKGILYKDKGTSILKELTERGKIAEKIFNNLELYRYDRDIHWHRRDGSIARAFYLQVKERYNFQIEDWALSEEKLEPYNGVWNTAVGRERYNLEWNAFKEHINFVRREKVKSTYLCITLQRFWRKIYFVRKRNTRVIQKAWRAFVQRAVNKGIYK